MFYTSDLALHYKKSIYSSSLGSIEEYRIMIIEIDNKKASLKEIFLITKSDWAKRLTAS